MNSKLFLAPIALVALAISGCGDTTVVTPGVEKKTIIKENPPTTTESKEKITKETPGGTTTIEKKTETK